MSTKLAHTNFIFLVSTSGSSTMRFSASMANSGMVNSAITSIEATVRNLEYIGMLSMKKLVKPMKLWPHDSSTDNIVAASSAHFIGPFTMNRPRMNSMSTKAPTYTGPLVPGCSPQYWPICWYTGRYMLSACSMAVLLCTIGTLAPPFTLGISSDHVSSMP